MAAVDRIMAERFGVAPIQLMELAGHAVATFTRLRFGDGDALDQPVTILAGSGGNGGDALVAARFLHGWGARVTVVLAKPAEALARLGAAHLRSLQALGVLIHDGATIEALPPDSVTIVDGLLGFSTTRAPAGTIARLIALANAAPAPVLAIDVPSGIDAATGDAFDPCIVAEATVTLGLPKTGLMQAGAEDVTGSLVLVDIGVPAAAYLAVGVTVPDDLFSDTWLLPLRGRDNDGTGGLRDD
jgi:NAD(P)H-hydrate epimerase